MDEYLQTAEDYAKAVLRQRSTNCRFIKQLSLLFLRQLNATQSNYYLSEIHAQRICAFIEHLPHVKGNQFQGRIKLSPWQIFHFVNVFGWLNGITDARKHSVAFTMVSKKNGKSTMAAPVGLFLISPLENEKGAEVYCAASKKAQARITLDIARQMLLSSSRVCDALNLSVWAHHVECEIGGIVSKMAAVASDSPDTDDGINPSGILLDELHAQVDGKLRATLLKGTAARRNSLVYQISTAGEYSDESPCVQEYEYSQKWIRGDVDAPWFFPMVYEQDDPSTEIDRPKTWCKSNPNVGTTMTLGSLKRIREDSIKSPALRNWFIQKHLNAFTEATDTWLDAHVWDRSQADPKDKPDDLPMFAGVDLSGVLDLTGIGKVWVDARERDPIFWIAGESYATKRGCDVNARLKHYVQLGQIHLVGETVINQSRIEDRVMELVNEENVVDVGFDPWNADNIALTLEDVVEMVEVRQGPRTFSEPMKMFLAALLDGRIRVIGDDCLRWQALNLQVFIDRNENWAPIKATKKNKVDAMVAILIAFVRAWRYVEEDRPLTADEVIGV